MLAAALALAIQAMSPLPDIQLEASVEARQLRIEKQGEASLTVRASPDAGSAVKVESPRGAGAKTLRNVRVKVDGQARIGEPNAAASSAQESDETDPDQLR